MKVTRMYSLITWVRMSTLNGGFLSITLFTHLLLAVLSLGCCVDLLQLQREGAALQLWYMLLFAAASLTAEHGLWAAWASVLAAPGSSAQTQQLWGMGLVALQHVGFPQIKDQSCVSRIGRWILYH